MHVLKKGFSRHTRMTVSNDGKSFFFWIHTWYIIYWVMPLEIISMMFTSNFIGVLFARSLHYQFYSWYFQTLPYLLWQCAWLSTEKGLKSTSRILIFVTIEGCWLTFPSTIKSSWTLAACHIMLLLGVFGNSPGPDYKVPSLSIDKQWVGSYYNH